MGELIAAPAASVRSWLRALWIQEVSDEAREPAPTDGAGLRKLLARPALLGALATLAITVGASQPSSPFTLKKTGAWFFGIPGPTYRPGQGLLLGLVAVYGGMLLLFKVWYGLARTLSRHRGAPAWSLVAVFALWVVPLLVAPPLFSQDAYSYAAQGEMASHHISPYQYGPSVLGANSYVWPVDQLWGNAPAPYGPLFLGAAGGITDLTGHHELATVIGMRLMALAGVALMAIFIPKLARSYGKDPGQALVLAILNPITLLHLIGGAHNDALMIGLLVAGITLAKRGRPVIGIVACALAASVKVPALIGVVYIGWDWVGSQATWKERVRPVVTACLVAGLVMGGLSQLTGLGWGWLWALGTPGTVRSLFAPATALGVLGGNIFHMIGVGPSQATVLTLARGAGLLVAGVLAGGLLWYSDRIGSVKALGLTLLAFVVLGPVVQPWYLAWGITVLAIVCTTGRLRVVLLWLSILASFIGLPGARILLDELGHASPGSVVVALLIVVAIPFTPVASALRRMIDRLRPNLPAG